MIKLRPLMLLVSISFIGISSNCKSNSPENQAITRNTPSNSSQAEKVNYMGSNKLPGEYLKAFLAAHQAFLADEGIPPQKKKVENYWIEFSEAAKSYEVFYLTKRKSHESELDGGESELGKDVRFLVSKNDYSILSRQFFK